MLQVTCICNLVAFAGDLQFCGGAGMIGGMGDPVGTSFVRKLRAKSGDDFGSLVLGRLMDTVKPEDVAAAISGGLQAVYMTKNGAAPDCRTRIEAAKLYLNYTVGLPVQRVVTATVGEREPEADVLARILSSPVARASLAAVLASSDEGRQLVAQAASMAPPAVAAPAAPAAPDA